MHAPPERVRPHIDRWAEVTDAPDGRCVVRMTADVLAWPAMALGMVGADFEVRSPPELAELVRDWGARFSRAAQARSA